MPEVNSMAIKSVAFAWFWFNSDMIQFPFGTDKTSELFTTLCGGGTYMRPDKQVQHEIWLQKIKKQ